MIFKVTNAGGMMALLPASQVKGFTFATREATAFLAAFFLTGLRGVLMVWYVLCVFVGVDVDKLAWCRFFASNAVFVDLVAVANDALLPNGFVRWRHTGDEKRRIGRVGS